jgi:hypothetical protein
MVVTSLTGTTTPVKLPEIPKVENTVSETQVIKSASKKEIGALMSTEQYVRKYFKDIPIMIEIARCESTFRQLDDDWCLLVLVLRVLQRRQWLMRSLQKKRCLSNLSPH